MSYITGPEGDPQGRDAVRVEAMGVSWHFPAWLVVVIVIAAVFLSCVVLGVVLFMLGGHVTPLDIEGIIHAFRH